LGACQQVLVKLDRRATGHMYIVATVPVHKSRWEWRSPRTAPVWGAAERYSCGDEQEGAT
jgi:hypothetical protein